MSTIYVDFYHGAYGDTLLMRIDTSRIDET